MKCPRCPASTLALSERQGIEIDYCPDCRGVWLDRGELDKLIALTAQAPAAMPSQHRSHGHSDFADSDYPASQNRHHSQAPRRKKSWLSDFFD